MMTPFHCQFNYLGSDITHELDNNNSYYYYYIVYKWDWLTLFIQKKWRHSDIMELAISVEFQKLNHSTKYTD